jgi:hypothetical protein
MTGSNVDHMDVGAYALGVLSDWEATQFEAHLAACDICARELEELTLVSSLLSHVDGDSLDAVEHYDRDGRQLDRMLNVVSLERRRSRTRRVLAAAAAVVVVAAGLAFGVAGMSLGGGGDTPTPRALPTPGESLRITGLVKRVEATDPVSGARAELALGDKGWGTQVQLKLTKVRGPLKCQLVAVGKDGQSVVAMTWAVPPSGYGTLAQPEPLILNGSASFKTADVDHFEVRPSGGTDDKNPLVTIPLT